MALERLSLQAIASIDQGRVEMAFNLALEKAIADLDDRGADKKPREVSITVIMTPEVEENQVEDVHVDFKIKCNVPAVRSRAYRMTPKGGKTLLFNNEAPENAKQRTMDEEVKPKPRS